MIYKIAELAISVHGVLGGGSIACVRRHTARLLFENWYTEFEEYL